MPNQVVVVVAGGGPPPVHAALDLPPGARVIAADGGLEHARALGLEVDVVIGDLDSVSASTLEEAARGGTKVIRHPVAKDATDLELALDEARELRPDRILLLASEDGRLDHLLSILHVLGSPRLAGVQVDAVVGRASVHVIRGERTLTGVPGELVSLLALHGRAEGVRTEGLVFPLAGETLEPDSSRGISNVFTGVAARIRVDRGVLLAVRPGPEEEGTE